MSKVLPIRFTEGSRTTLCVILSITNWMCIIISLGLVTLGAFIKLYVEEFTNLVENYDGNTFPFMLIGIGLFSLCLNIVSGLLFHMGQDPEKRAIIQHFLLVYIIFQSVAACAFLASGVMCYIHVNHLEDSFRGGIVSAMRRYRLEPHVKLETDILQSQFMCCGNDKYTDWFSVDWIPDENKPDFSFGEPVIFEAENVSLDAGITRVTFHHDHVPTSCCDFNVTRPCISRDVHDNEHHASYNYIHDLTLHKIGCREALMNYFGDTVLANAALAIFGVFILQIILVFVTRYLHTSVSGALEQGDATADSQGYLCNCGEDKSDDEEDDEEDEERENLLKDGMSDAGFALDEFQEPVMPTRSSHMATRPSHAAAAPHFSPRMRRHSTQRHSHERLPHARLAGEEAPTGSSGALYSRNSAILAPSPIRSQQLEQSLVDLAPHKIPTPPPPPPLPPHLQ